MLLLLIIILLVVALAGGVWASPRWGWVGISPLGIVLLILLVLFLTGNLRV